MKGFREEAVRLIVQGAWVSYRKSTTQIGGPADTRSQIRQYVWRKFGNEGMLVTDFRSSVKSVTVM